MKNLFEKYSFMFGIAGVLIALDQWTKWLVRTNIVLGDSWLPESLAWLSPYARIVNWYNTGAAFGMFKNGSLIFATLAFIVIGALIYYFPQVEKSDWTLRLAMSMQLAGASGNLIDRLLHDWKVTDFNSVGTFPFQRRSVIGHTSFIHKSAEGAKGGVPDRRGGFCRRQFVAGQGDREKVDAVDHAPG